jgi:hypothetical protein
MKYRICVWGQDSRLLILKFRSLKRSDIWVQLHSVNITHISVTFQFYCPTSSLTVQRLGPNTLQHLYCHSKGSVLPFSLIVCIVARGWFLVIFQLFTVGSSVLFPRVFCRFIVATMVKSDIVGIPARYHSTYCMYSICVYVLVPICIAIGNYLTINKHLK